MSDRLDAAVAELVAALRAEFAPPAPVAPRPLVLLSIVAAAQELSVSRSALYREIQAGRLETVKVGRRRLVSQAALAEYVERAGRGAA